MICNLRLYDLLFIFEGTPGRLNDLLMNEILSVQHVTYLVCIVADYDH